MKFCWHDWLVVRSTNETYSERHEFDDVCRNTRYSFFWSKQDKICRKCGKIRLKLQRAINKIEAKKTKRAIIESNDDELKGKVNKYIEMSKRAN